MLSCYIITQRAAFPGAVNGDNELSLLLLGFKTDEGDISVCFTSCCGGDEILSNVESFVSFVLANVEGLNGFGVRVDYEFEIGIRLLLLYE